jgi:WD40 repeat protein
MPTEIKNFKLLKDAGRQEIFFCLARVPNSSRLVAGASDGKVYDFDLLAEKIEFRDLPGHSSYVTGIVLAGENMVSGSYDGKLIWRKLADGEQVRSHDAHSKWIRKLAISPDGARIASVADDMICRVWDAADGKLLHELRGHEERTPNHFPSMLYTCCFAPDGQTLATADRTGRINLWNLATYEKRLTIEAPGFYTWDPKQRIHSIGGIRSLTFSPDSKTLVAGGIGHIGNIDHLDGPARVEVFSAESGEKQQEFLGDMKGMVQTLAFHPEGKWLVGGGGDNGGLVQFYDLEAKKVIRGEKSPMHIHAACVDETGARLFAVGHGKAAVWEVETAQA